MIVGNNLSSTHGANVAGIVKMIRVFLLFTSYFSGVKSWFGWHSTSLLGIAVPVVLSFAHPVLPEDQFRNRSWIGTEFWHLLIICSLPVLIKW